MFTPEINKAATEAFQSIIKAKGREILKNSKSVQNLMSDFLPGYEYESIRNLIKIAAEWNIFAILFDESIPEENRVEYAAKQMTEKTFVPLETTRVVVSWAAEALYPGSTAKKGSLDTFENSDKKMSREEEMDFIYSMFGMTPPERTKPKPQPSNVNEQRMPITVMFPLPCSRRPHLLLS